MDFGKVEEENLEYIDFKLPPDTAGTVRLLDKQSKKEIKTNILIGCAKWGRKDWVGKIYPPKTKDADFLLYYAKHFTCIELNATFYRMPTEAQTSAWRNKVGKGFKFCPKFVDQISHFKRLKDAEDATNQFLKGVSGFEDNLGPIFLQLPPNFTPKSYDVLEKYLAFLPEELNVFVELRSDKWFETPDEFERVFDLLERYKKGAVITDASGRRDCVHMRLTTSEAFLRFVGNGLHPTDYTRCDDWINRIKIWMDKKIETIYFFMHQHEEIHSPELCKYVIGEMNKKLGTKILMPKFIEDQGLMLDLK